MNEDKLQAECFQWAKNNYCLNHHKPKLSVFSVPNGGSRNKIEAIKLNATGLTAGVSDLIGLFDNGKTIFFELKIEGGKQSDKQKEFQKIVSNLGFEYHIIFTFEKFKEIWMRNV